ncbi:glycosyltransferase [Actinospongicola halichondriae]|uniref:glycosyltransferase n=1 Tax=Actinospongicola halichondriae TaxID=3236844 RepID=UPI003D3A596B
MTPTKRLVIVVRADPVICGHSGEARNLAEAALLRGFDDVRIVTWPLDALGDLPCKPMDTVLAYSPGITVERPPPVGDYKVPDGRHVAGMVGRLVELFTDGVPTTAMSLYLMPHANIVMEALHIARQIGKPVDVTTIAEAVGSDITNIVRSCVDEGRFGAAAQVYATYLGHDRCVAVSDYTKQCIVESAETVDRAFGTTFADQCRARVTISYPAVNSRTFTDIEDFEIDRALASRGLERDDYVLFLSRLTPAKGVDDLIEGFTHSCVAHTRTLVIAGTGAAAGELRAQAAATGLGGRIVFLDDVDDDEKRMLLAGSAAYVLPSKPMQEFVETFGIALVEKMLAGGGPIITTETGGIPEAVGDCATIVPPGSPTAIADALDEVLLVINPAERAARAEKARKFALQFDRLNVFDRLFAPVDA